MTRINTLTGAELRVDIFNALMLHLQCMGPIVRPTLSVRWPHFSHSISGYISVPNRFLGEAAHIPPAHTDKLRRTVEILLSRSWDGRNSGEIIDVVLELMDARMRAANVRCAYAILATAFEAAFSQKEQDWSGASKRAAALAARTQTERRDFHRRLDSSSQVRGLRNQVLHGRTVDDRKLRTNRSFLSEILSKGVLSLFDDFSENDIPNSYYDRLLELARTKESSLH